MEHALLVSLSDFLLVVMEFLFIRCCFWSSGVTCKNLK